MAMRATYQGPDGREITLSDDDMLWAARGITGESRGNASRELCAAFLWAIMRRCLLLGSSRTYGKMWIDFSQPINPIWLETGWKCAPGGPYHGKENCSKARTDYRAALRKKPWEKLPEQIRDAVEDFAQGKLPPPMFERTLTSDRNRITNWASYAGVEALYPQGTWFQGEWFLQDKGLIPGDVKITGVSEVLTPPFSSCSGSPSAAPSGLVTFGGKLGNRK
jgi:hypothetical protein